MSAYIQAYEKKLVKKQLLLLGVLVILFFGILLYFYFSGNRASEPINLNQATDLTDLEGEYFNYSIGELSYIFAEDENNDQYALGYVGEKSVIIQFPIYDLNAAENLITYWENDTAPPESAILHKTGRMMTMDSELRDLAKEYLAYSMEQEVSDEDFDQWVWPVVLDTGAPIPQGEDLNIAVGILTVIFFILVFMLGIIFLIRYKKFRRQIEKYVNSTEAWKAFDEEMEAEPQLNYQNTLIITKNWVIVGGGKKGFYQTAIHLDEIVCIYGRIVRNRHMSFRQIVARTRNKKRMVIAIAAKNSFEALLENIQSKLPWAWHEDYDKKMGMDFQELVEHVQSRRKEHEQNLALEVNHEG